MRRSHSFTLLALACFSLSIGVQTARAQDACAAVSADPSALTRLQGSPDFMAMVSDMSKSCPDLLLALDLPTEMLAELGLTGQRVSRVAGIGQNRNDRKVEDEVEVETPSAAAEYLAKIDAASKKLDAAVADVTDARAAVDTALGNVRAVAARQALVPEARTVLTRLGFGKYAAERREAARALDAAKQDYAAAQDQLSKVVEDTAKVVSDADAELAKAKLAISDVFDDEDYPVAQRIDELAKTVASAEAQLGKLNAELEPIQKAYDDAVAKVKAAEAPYTDAQGRYTVAYNRLVDIKSLCATECTPELKIEAEEVDKAIKQAMVDIDTATKAILEASKVRNEVAGKKEGVTQAIDGQVRYVAILRSEQDSYIALDKAATDAVTQKKAAEAAQTVQTDAARTEANGAQVRLLDSIRTATVLLKVSEAEAADAAALKAAADTLDAAGLALDKAAQDARDVAKTVAGDPSAEVKTAAEALIGQVQEAEATAESTAGAVARAKAAEAENEAAKDDLAEAMPPSKS